MRRRSIVSHEMLLIQQTTKLENVFFLRREITLEIMYNQTPSRSKYCCILLRYYANLTCGISYSLINSFHNSVNNALISYHAPVFCPSITVVHCFAKPALPIIINILAKYREINLINKIGLGDRASMLEEEVFMETMQAATTIGTVTLTRTGR